MTGLVGILSSLVLVGCVDSTRTEPRNYTGVSDTNLEVVVEEPVVEEPVAPIKPEPLVFSREDIIFTLNDWDRSLSGVVFSHVFGSKPERERKISKVIRYPKQAFEAFSEEDLKEYQLYFSGNPITTPNHIVLNDVFSDFDWNALFDKKMELVRLVKEDIDFDLKNLSDSDLLLIFLDEKLKGFPYTPYVPKGFKFGEHKDLYHADMYAVINGNNSLGKEIRFPVKVGNVRYYLDVSFLDRRSRWIEKDLTDEQAAEEIYDIAREITACRLETKYLTCEEEDKLFDNKENPLYNCAEQRLINYLDSIRDHDSFKKLVQTRFENRSESMSGLGNPFKDVNIGSAVLEDFNPEFDFKLSPRRKRR